MSKLPPTSFGSNHSFKMQDHKLPLMTLTYIHTTIILDAYQKTIYMAKTHKTVEQFLYLYMVLTYSNHFRCLHNYDKLIKAMNNFCIYIILGMLRKEIVLLTIESWYNTNN